LKGTPPANHNVAEQEKSRVMDDGKAGQGVQRDRSGDRDQRGRNLKKRRERQDVSIGREDKTCTYLGRQQIQPDEIKG